MATVTDEDTLELVERFDIDIEDYATLSRLKAALVEKIHGDWTDAGITNLARSVRRGYDYKYSYIEPLGLKAVPVYRDPRGRWASPKVAAEAPWSPTGLYTVELGYQDIVSRTMAGRETVRLAIEAFF